MSNPALDALAAMGVDVQKIDIFDMSKSNNKSVDRRICMCGHSVDRHKDPSTYPNPIPILKSNNPNGEFICQPNAMTCSCKKVIPVLEVSNPKYFLKKTEGAGELHALTRGIRGLAKVEGNYMKWLIEPECRRCGCTGAQDRIVPATFTADGQLKKTSGSDGYDAFICEKCRIAS
ncbi:MAG: hypothetical protein LW628_09200 [Fimbriimonadaceae bacterium]|jgi:hypothetical protein|nr:hypothetical protein [Fimbriimonadaceae bacterium]